MKYKLKYFTKMDKEVLQKIDELEIKYNERNTHIVEFVQEQPSQQIIIVNLDSEENMLLFIKNKEYEKIKDIPNIKISLAPALFHNIEIMEKFQENGIAYYIDIAAYTWQHIHILIEKKVSDILITGPIGLEIKDIATRLHNLGIQVRAIPNYIHKEEEQSSFPTFTSFYIRPEDVEEYEEYIDVLEFPHADLTKALIYYKIYAEDKKWYGNLQEIIEGLDEEFNSKYIMPVFAQMRLNCRRSCFTNGKCQICHKVKELSENLKKIGIIVEREKKEEDEEWQEEQ